MNTSKISVLVTCAGVIRKHKGNWSTASQNKILDLLKAFHNTAIKRRQLGYHLADLRKEGFIKTIKRHHRDPNGTIHPTSSATCLTMKGCHVLFRLGQTWAMRHFNKLRKAYGPLLGDAPPRKRGSQPILIDTSYDGDNPFMDSQFRRKKGLTAVPLPLRPLKA